MEFHPRLTLGVLFIALIASQAVIPSELYWNSVLPNTPMPRLIKDLLRPGLGKDGVKSYAGRWKVSGGNHVPDSLTTYTGDLNVVPDSLTTYTGDLNVVPDSLTTYNGGNNLVPDSLTTYNGGNNADKNYDPNASLFLLEKDMIAGTKMNLHFTKSVNSTVFLPRQIVDSTPFSLDKFPEILNRFSVKADSIEGRLMKRTIKECEEPGIKGEERFCSTSLESMIDFATMKLGKRLLVLATEVQNENQIKKYTFMREIKKVAEEKSVVCHKLNYPYAVFYCHAIPSTSVYTVPLVAVDGSKAKAVAVCHKDTLAWDPNHLAFKVLKVKPGTIPICHFLPEETVAWTPN